MSEKEIKMGGQAVIEGVMMRSENQWAVAVRTPQGEILIRRERWQPVTQRFPFLKLPVLRGAVILFETLILGVKALNFSADVAATAEEDGQAQVGMPPPEEKKGFWWSLSLFGTVAFSLLLGLATFFYLPLWLTELMGIDNSFLFNLVDGVLRIAFFLLYLWLISKWSQIRRVFEYHGAEHKTISAYENQRELTWQNIQGYSTFHPRCGTSFVLVLMLVSILCFMLLGKPTDLPQRLIRMLCIPLIGGVSYELIKLSSRHSGHALFRFIIAPGLWLQRITTRQPDQSQVEVAVAALKAALGLEQPAAVEPQLAAPVQVN
jgi:uncharacterized protein YqhQ